MKRSEIKKEVNKLLTNFFKKNNFYNSSKVSLSNPSFDQKEVFSVFETIFDGWISQGPNVKKFEKDFAKKIGTKYAIASNSGSSANLLALQALKNIYHLKEGDEVIIPASTFATVAMPIIQIGLKPVYVDIDPKTLNIDIKEIEKAITIKTKIIMPVHTLGLPSRMKEIIKISKKYKLFILEDCCEAHGSKIGNKKVGSFGHVSAFSFYVAHNITTGEGGMVLTNNLKIAKECRSLREFGRCDQKDINKNRFYSDKFLKDYDKRYVFTKIGFNLRMTDICAAIGIQQLKKMDKLNDIRRQNANLLANLILKDLNDKIDLPIFYKDYFHTFYTFPMILKKNNSVTRKQITNFLEKNNIETRPLFGGCLPDQPGLRNQPGRSYGNLVNSRYIKDNAFFVGIHPSLSKNDIFHIHKTLKKILVK